MCIFSPSRTALGEVIPQVVSGRADKLMIHTAGSMPMSLFEGMALHYGVLYPMQTFSKLREVDFKVIPCFVEGNDSYALSAIVELASSVSDRVSELSSDDRRYLHLAAVWACNFTNHCYEVSAELLRKHGIPLRCHAPAYRRDSRKSSRSCTH